MGLSSCGESKKDSAGLNKKLNYAGFGITELFSCPEFIYKH